MTSSEPIAIIGAGLAGLSAARLLADAGRSVTVFDKSRGTGGRLATRRTDAGAFDHGAPGVQVRSAGFRQLVNGLVEEGAAEWRTDAVGNDAVGLPGMSGLVKPLARGLDLRGGVRIDRLTRDGDGWVLDHENGHEGPFGRVVLAVPAPQAAALLSDIAGPDALAGAQMAPQYTLMAAWDHPVRPDPAEGVFAQLLPQGGGNEASAWVAHAAPGWTAQNLELDRDAACDALLEALGVEARPGFAAAHRWRFARTAQALGAPFLSLEQGTILAGGDWALGDSADHAWQSGDAMARAILDGAA